MGNWKYLVFLFIFLFSGCISSSDVNSPSPDLPDELENIVGAGDTVLFDYIISTVDNEVIDTSFEEIALNWNLNLTHSFEPISVKVGSGRVIPGLEGALEGMRVGEQKEFIVTPEKGYGERNPSLVKTYSRKLEFPRFDTLKREAFKTIFQDEPTLAKNYSLNYWNVTVVDISGNDVTVFNDARNETIMTHNGAVRLEVDENTVFIEFEPFLNNSVMNYDGLGKVVMVDEKNYTLDLNHPLAGESFRIFILVKEITKPQPFISDKAVLGGVVFMTSFEKAKEIAQETGKPIFLYAHASWCSWCRKFEEDVLRDEVVIQTLQSDFVSVAFEVDSQVSLTKDYRIFGTPTMIFLDENGLEVRRIRGYSDLKTFKGVLSSVKGEV
jgi:FKBP-type peptidyl-prolyl cis-trans isomerase 2